MTIFHHILVPVDGSETAAAAAKFAIGFAGPQSRITFPSSVDVNRIYVTATQSPFSNPAPVIEANK